MLRICRCFKTLCIKKNLCNDDNYNSKQTFELSNYKPFNFCSLPFAFHFSLMTNLYSLFTTYYLQLTNHQSLFTFYYLLLTTH